MKMLSKPTNEDVSCCCLYKNTGWAWTRARNWSQLRLNILAVNPDALLTKTQQRAIKKKRDKGMQQNGGMANFGIMSNGTTLQV
ncbi:hypothetical protein L1987_36369 [Smallanthus sonchifolius]|uniref:Uncharacterized protein n=1 Tax=Smallanthus sonchifolius TaxID=185202 RepID=A0ACB9HDE1_9ASTR|nr:hypothetical protein L1987_36369 [Smallanthus sonchifolius]